MGLPSVLGIDIGSSSVKITHLELTSTGWQMNAAVICETPPGSVIEGVVKDTSAVAAVISKAVKDHGIKVNTAVTAVSGTGVVVREVNFPKLSPKLLEQTIHFEAQKHLSIPVDDCQLGYSILPTTLDMLEQPVMLVAVPNELLNGHMSAITQAGIEVIAVDVNGFCLERALYGCIQEDGEDRENTVCILDIGSSLSSLYLKSRSVPILIRTVSIGLDAIVKAIAAGLRINEQPAAQLMLDLDMRDLLHRRYPEDATQTDEMVSHATALRLLQEQLDEVLREVRRSMQFHQSQIPDSADEHIKRMTLSGGIGQIAGVCDYMAARLGLDVRLAQPLEDGFIRVMEGGPSEKAKWNMLMGVAMGCSMHVWAAEKRGMKV